MPVTPPNPDDPELDESLVETLGILKRGLGLLFLLLFLRHMVAWD